MSSILDDAVAGRPVPWEAWLPWMSVRVDALKDLRAAADEVRRQEVGDTVTYVVNRNVNFTNVCVKSCRFCAYARGYRSEQGYRLPIAEVVRRCQEAWELGATEVCLQAGLAPGLTGQDYVELCRAIKQALPTLHVHGFSPEEIKYGARCSGWSFREQLERLVDVGLDSIPGTSAEILDDALRRRIAPARITTSEWLEVIREAHALGLPTTATIMYGHLDSPADRLRHLALLDRVQRETGGFTEFVPLSFVHAEAPMWQQQRPEDLADGPTDTDTRSLAAVARLVLGRSFKNLQASWVKEGLELATELLDWGANDLGGTLINESISTSAGAPHGQRRSPSQLRAAIRSAGRTPAQRNTLYGQLRRFEDPVDDPVEPLDALEDPEGRFGSYSRLVQDDRYRISRRR